MKRKWEIDRVASCSEKAAGAHVQEDKDRKLREEAERIAHDLEEKGEFVPEVVKQRMAVSGKTLVQTERERPEGCESDVMSCLFVDQHRGLDGPRLAPHL